MYCGFGKEQKRIESDFLYDHAFYSKALKDKVDSSCRWTPGVVSPVSASCAAVLQEVESRAPHRAGGGPSEYVYDQCGFNPQAAESEQQRLLRGDGRGSSASSTGGGAAAVATGAESQRRDSDVATSPTAASAPPALGMLYRWCGGREEAQPVWNALPAAAAAMNMLKGFDPSLKMEYTRGQSKSIYWVSPENLLENTLLPSIYADVRYIDDVIAF